MLQIQACLKEIHAKMLRKHLQLLEQPLDGEDKTEDAYVVKSEEDTEDIKGISFLSLFSCLWNIAILWASSIPNFMLIFACYSFVVRSADESFSPEPIKGEDQEVEDEPGSFSPELLHGDEDEEAIDPEEDRALLVIFLNIVFNCDLMSIYIYG